MPTAANTTETITSTGAWTLAGTAVVVHATAATAFSYAFGSGATAPIETERGHGAEQASYQQYSHSAELPSGLSLWVKAEAGTPITITALSAP